MAPPKHGLSSAAQSPPADTLDSSLRGSIAAGEVYVPGMTAPPARVSMYSSDGSLDPLGVTATSDAAPSPVQRADAPRRGLTEEEKRDRKNQKEKERTSRKVEMYEQLNQLIASVSNAPPPETYEQTWDEAFLMVQVLQSGTNDILAQLNAPPLPAYVPLARGNLQPRATATPSANSISLKSTDMIPSTTSNPQILPRLASLSKTSKGKQKSKDMTRPMTESREGLSRTVTEEDGEGREADVEDSKSFKVTDPFNIVRPRCPNCSAVRCSRDHSEEWCDCECWMCGRSGRKE